MGERRGEPEGSSRFRDTNDELQRSIAERIPQSRSLDYKEQLELDTDSQKRELLTDLTGTENGGGGKIIHRMREAADRSGRPVELMPLTDPAPPGRRSSWNCNGSK
ncbi:hypothetical protein A7Q09_05380 [Methylacidiphilum sp. Yel]|nr:hypothetical protein A7Q09_05380 [Methylacidiphilum sp. Yel]